MEPWIFVLFAIVLPGIILAALITAVVMRPEGWDQR